MRRSRLMRGRFLFFAHDRKPPRRKRFLFIGGFLPRSQLLAIARRLPIACVNFSALAVGRPISPWAIGFCLWKDVSKGYPLPCPTKRDWAREGSEGCTATLSNTRSPRQEPRPRQPPRLRHLFHGRPSRAMFKPHGQSFRVRGKLQPRQATRIVTTSILPRMTRTLRR